MARIGHYQHDVGVGDCQGSLGFYGECCWARKHDWKGIETAVGGYDKFSVGTDGIGAGSK